jgi:hypothetical protein
LKKWGENESSWQCHDQELGAIIQAFIEWRAWLIDTREPVEVFSDHAKLKYFTSNQNLSDCQTCWAVYLSSFNFVIKHVPGKLNPANPPTRCPDFLPSGEDDDRQRTLIVSLANGLRIQGVFLDEWDPNVEIGEVDLGSSLSPLGQDPDSSPAGDCSFCPPSALLKGMLTQAYAAASFQMMHP